MNVNWIIDVDIIRLQHLPTLKSLESNNFKVSKISVTADLPKINPQDELIHIYLGSVESLSIGSNLDICMRTYGLNEKISQSVYRSYIPNEWLLNQDSVLTTWNHFVTNYKKYFGMFNNRGSKKLAKVFVRPNNGYKSFSGKILYKNSFVKDINCEMFDNIEPHELIYVSSFKELCSQEYRVWIVNKQIITWSKYGIDYGTVDGLPDSILGLAEKIAAHNWQVDYAYVADFTLLDNKPKLIEFNSFACSDLYECDSEKLLLTISNNIMSSLEDY